MIGVGAGVGCGVMIGSVFPPSLGCVVLFSEGGVGRTGVPVVESGFRISFNASLFRSFSVMFCLIISSSKSSQLMGRISIGCSFEGKFALLIIILLPAVTAISVPGIISFVRGLRAFACTLLSRTNNDEMPSLTSVANTVPRTAATMFSVCTS